MTSTSFPSTRLLLGPGPSNPHPRVVAALARPMQGHLDPEFLQVLESIQHRLRQVLLTQNEWTWALPATGMGGMECLLNNLLEPGDKILVCVQGFFSERMVEISRRHQADVATLEIPWGETFSLDQLREKIRAHEPKIVALVHAETSTGTLQPLAGLGSICHEHDALLLVDAVTSLGCVELRLDDWQIDAVYSCSQKGLGCPPGMSPISLSPRAVETLQKRKSAPSSWYFDLKLLHQYWSDAHVYHHTAPISMSYALAEGLQIVLDEGLLPRWQRHLEVHADLVQQMQELGIEFLTEPSKRLPQLNVVKIPINVDDAATRKRLLLNYNIEIGGGLGQWKGQAWRIGLMGYNAQPSSVMMLAAALRRLGLGQ